MFMDDGEEIRFKVMEEVFVDISPSAGQCSITELKSNSQSVYEITPPVYYGYTSDLALCSCI